MKTTYTAVVESGSCSEDYTRWEERYTCGHKHRSIAAAYKCMQRKQRWYCPHGRISGTPCSQCGGYAQGSTTSADWYNATIHNQNQGRVDYVVDYDKDGKEFAY